jgi:hypothetical protein
MEIGMGIFLSSVLISLVLLYRFTRDRWNWKIIAAAPLLLAMVGGAYYYYEEVMPKPPKPIKPYTGHGGVNLGMTYNDVVFLLGKPESEKIIDSSIWLKYSGMRVGFDKDAKLANRIWVWSSNCFTLNVANISACSGIDKLVKKFGEPSKIETSKDGLRRIYFYPNYHLALAFAKNKVEVVAIFDPATSDRGIGLEN